jgi:CDP-diacylglycerol--glycerol-3-phosphate 3-phosphatidyltransferase
VIESKARHAVALVLWPVTSFLVRVRLHPDFMTLLGFVINLIAGLAFADGRFRLAGLLVLTAGLCDVLDGQIARTGRQGSKFGALLDSTVDRYSEILVFFGISVYFVKLGEWGTGGALFFALSGSLMVSYVRARAEGLGEECKVGFFQRPERVIAMGVGALIGRAVLEAVVWIIAILANYTVGERLWYIWKKTKDSRVKKRLDFKQSPEGL